ncbi:MAG: glycerol dehydrogenase, partial [Candidatus Methanomethylophilaceae archaeon]|nr:glycerol dehydrogenase [Candidatus Methanomethylophilaceae archaeon]
TMVNRVLLAGVLVEKENTGTEEEPMWRARIQDINGNFFLNVGRFQPEAAAAMADLEAPSYVAVIGKIRTYSPEEGKVYISIRPERIVQIEEKDRNLWLLEAAQCMWDRLLKVREAVKDPDAGINDLISKGFTQQEAEGVCMALEHYGNPESTVYLKTLQSALRKLLPDNDVDFGLPEDMGEYPDEMDDEIVDDDVKVTSSSSAPSAPVADSGNDMDKEEIILGFIDRLDPGGSAKGAPRDEIERLAAEEGISANEVEEISDSLMDKGLIYEPNLGYLRKI